MKQTATVLVKAENINVETTRAEDAKHPGQVLYSDFMKPADISGARLALALRITSARMSEILNGKRGITAESALRLSAYFGTTARFWLDLQADYDLSLAAKKWADSIEAEVQPLNGTTKSRQEKSGPKQSLPSPKLEGNEKKLYDALSDEEVGFDRLCDLTGMDSGELSASITMLELEELIEVHPGYYFTKQTRKR
jgi:addiction module HigA family antidote